MFFREDEDAVFEQDTNEWVTRKQAERIRELKKELAAARLAGKIEGMKEAYVVALNIKEMPLEKEGDAMLDAIRAKIAELEATAAATPRLSEEPSE